MRSTLGLVAALALLAPAALVLTPSTAQACSCMSSPDALAAARDSSVVFEGKLVAVDSPKPSKPSDLPSKIFTFEVTRTFKGQLDSQVRVVTADNSAACGRDYGKVGDTWLVYARTWDTGEIHDNLCSRTMPSADAAADIEVLLANAGALDKPAEPEPELEPESEPEPVEPKPASETPPPAEPSKKGCAVGDEPEPFAALALLALLALPWSRSRARARGR